MKWALSNAKGQRRLIAMLALSFGTLPPAMADPVVLPVPMQAFYGTWQNENVVWQIESNLVGVPRLLRCNVEWSDVYCNRLNDLKIVEQPQLMLWFEDRIGLPYGGTLNFGDCSIRMGGPEQMVSECNRSWPVPGGPPLEKDKRVWHKSTFEHLQFGNNRVIGRKEFDLDDGIVLELQRVPKAPNEICVSGTIRHKSSVGAIPEHCFKL